MCIDNKKNQLSKYGVEVWEKKKNLFSAWSILTYFLYKSVCHIQLHELKYFSDELDDYNVTII